MTPLTHTGASHFVQNFSSNASVSSLEVSDFLDRYRNGFVFKEGTNDYIAFRDCLLRDSERSLLMSNNCYARALDGLRANSAYWSFVGLYYSSFFAAKSVLGMHGCWMDSPTKWVEVLNSNAGSQEFIYKNNRQQIYSNNRGKKGSHRVTWVAFYNAMNHLTAWYASHINSLAMNPVNSNYTWLIDSRNEYNYSSFEAFTLMKDFQTAFDPTNIPNCFGGKLQTMLQVSKAFIHFSKDVSTQLRLATDVCSSAPTRLDWVKRHITSNQHVSLSTFAHSEYGQLEF